MGKIVGIDFGTTNSSIAIFRNGHPEIIPNRRGNRLTPSAVCFLKDKILVGEPAKAQRIVNADRTVFAIKRFMGQNFVFEVDGEKYTAPQIASIILRKLKEDAEHFLNEEVKDCVITVPAYFNEKQREEVKESAELAGLNVIRMINEPTSACLAYGLNMREGIKNVIVFDIGGGTYDVSVLEVGEGVFEVKASCGNNKLGGEDFDQRIMEYVIEKYKEETGIDLSEDKAALQKLKEASEQAKITLSEEETAHISVPFITADETGPKHLDMEITRELFEDLISDLLEKLIPPAESALNDAQIDKKDIDIAILVGGSTRVPAVRRKLREFLEGQEPVRDINPDECVALGAAIQAAIIENELEDVVLIDVTPFTLGVEIENDGFAPIIPRNTVIPTSNSRIFTTVADNQTSVKIHVLQGESDKASKNVSIGYFELKGIRLAKAGEPRIEVTFTIDANGILKVSARDMDTGAQHSIEIKDYGKENAKPIQNTGNK